MRIVMCLTLVIGGLMVQSVGAQNTTQNTQHFPLMLVNNTSQPANIKQYCTYTYKPADNQPIHVNRTDGISLCSNASFIVPLGEKQRLLALGEASRTDLSGKYISVILKTSSGTTINCGPTRWEFPGIPQVVLTADRKCVIK